MTNPSPPGGPPDKSRPFGMAYRSLPASCYGLPNTPGLPFGPSNHSWLPGSTSRPSGLASRPLPDFRKGLPTLPALQEGLPTTPCPTRGSSDHVQPSEMSSRPLSALWDGILSTAGTPGELPYHYRPSWKVSRISG